MFNIENYLKKNNIIENKNFGKFLHPLNEEKFIHLKNKKFFELDDFKKIKGFEKIWLWIIEGKKNIGKTHEICQRMWKIENEKNSKLMFGRLSRDEMITVAKAMNNDTSGFWPFKVKKGEFYSKQNGEHKGSMFYLKGSGLQKFASAQFPEYGNVLLDEYQPATQPDNDLTQNVRDFLIFLSNVQRNKPNLLVEMYANNYSDFDPFKKYFKVNFKESFLVDEEAGLAIINLRDYYIGVSKNSNAHKLLKYDEDLLNFFDKNESGEFLNDILPITYFDKLRPSFQLVINKEGYIIYMLEDMYLAVKKSDKLWRELPIYANNLKDASILPNTEIILSENNFEIAELIIEMILEHNIVYDSPQTKFVITHIFGSFVKEFYKN